MKRIICTALCLILVLPLLSACSGENPAEPPLATVTQYLGPAPTDTPTPAPAAQAPSGDGTSVFDQNPYDVGFTEDDALGEEDYVDDGVYDDGASGDALAVSAETTFYPYAGATPIPLNPLDMPTPTPRPDLTFTFVPYTASQLGLTFEAPAGWIPDESVGEVYTLTEPDQQIKDGQPGIINVYASPVTSNYSQSNLRTEVLQRLETIGSRNFTEWNPSLTASRYLMGSAGVYVNYTGTLADGVGVGGRIHCTCIDNVLYCIQITYPRYFRGDYEEVFAKVRETIKRVQ